jgi:hypothetical protein
VCERSVPFGGGFEPVLLLEQRISSVGAASQSEVVSVRRSSA